MFLIQNLPMLWAAHLNKLLLTSAKPHAANASEHQRYERVWEPQQQRRANHRRAKLCEELGNPRSAKVYEEFGDRNSHGRTAGGQNSVRRVGASQVSKP
jgi:hypothetical protein